MTDGSTSLTYAIKVVNSGLPSIAWRWHAKVQLVSGQIFEADAAENPQSLVSLSQKKDQPELRFEPGNYLPSILLESPLATGSAKMGWVMFRFNNLKPEELNRIGNKMELTFQDSEERITTDSFVLSQNLGTY
jgi:hypothetical protein